MQLGLGLGKFYELTTGFEVGTVFDDGNISTARGTVRGTVRVRNIELLVGGSGLDILFHEMLT